MRRLPEWSDATTNIQATASNASPSANNNAGFSTRSSLDCTRLLRQPPWVDFGKPGVSQFSQAPKQIPMADCPSRGVRSDKLFQRRAMRIQDNHI
jgi:hypothetical protein